MPPEDSPYEMTPEEEREYDRRHEKAEREEYERALADQVTFQKESEYVAEKNGELYERLALNNSNVGS